MTGSIRNNESPEEKFIKIAEQKMNKTLKYITLLQNVVKSKRYKPNDEQINKIDKTLFDEIAKIRTFYEARQHKEKTEFRF